MQKHASRPVPASRATARTRSSTPPSTCSSRSATTDSPWTPSPGAPRPARPRSTDAGTARPSLVVDAMVRAKQAPQIEKHDTGSLRGDLISTFCGSHGMGDATMPPRSLGSVITALASDPEFAELFREAFIAPKVEVSRDDLRPRHRARRDPGRRRHRDHRPGPRRDPAAPLLRARRGPRRRDRRARHRPGHPSGRDHAAATINTKTRHRRKPGPHDRHLDHDAAHEDGRAPKGSGRTRLGRSCSSRWRS